jgi:hypothetical protein
MAIKSILLGLLAMLVSGVQADDDNVSATILWYTEQESGIDPYRVRYIVTRDFLRSDDGIDSDDFLLFDRKQKSIYSVVGENRSVLQIDGGVETSAAPPELAMRVDRHADASAPKVGDRTPVTLELLAGDSVCKSAVIAPGFLDEERKVFLEFSHVVAAQQARTLNNTPAELRTHCFLARYLYAHDFHLTEGMLLAEWSPNGERRELVGIEEHVAVPLSLFVIPDDYSVMRTSER